MNLFKGIPVLKASLFCIIILCFEMYVGVLLGVQIMNNNQM